MRKFQKKLTTNIPRYFEKCGCNNLIMPKARNLLTFIIFSSSSSQIANCLFLGSYRSRSFIMLHIFLITVCLGKYLDPISFANSGDNFTGFLRWSPRFSIFFGISWVFILKYFKFLLFDTILLTIKDVVYLVLGIFLNFSLFL